MIKKIISVILDKIQLFLEKLQYLLMDKSEQNLYVDLDGDEDQFDVYKPVDRAIYTYWNGNKEIKADPITLYKKVMAVGQELSVDMKVARSPMKDAPQAHDEAVKKIRTVFQIKSLEEGGLTEGETLDLLDHFLIYVESVKKNSNPHPTPPEATSLSTSLPSAPSGGAGSPPDQPSKNTQDSGSTGKESSTEQQGQSPSAQG